LRVTDTTISSAVLIVDPPYEFNPEEKDGKLTLCESSSPAVMFLELPAYPVYRNRPFAPVFWFAEDKDTVRGCCQDFALRFCRGTRLPS